MILKDGILREKNKVVQRGFMELIWELVKKQEIKQNVKSMINWLMASVGEKNP